MCALPRILRWRAPPGFGGTAALVLDIRLETDLAPRQYGAVADLHYPDWYLTEDLHQTFAELRRVDPVHWQEMPAEPGYWAVLGYADVVHVSRHPEAFSSWLGGVLLEDPDPERLEETRRMLLVMDPPQHGAYRQPLTPHFGARIISRMETPIRVLCPRSAGGCRRERRRGVLPRGSRTARIRDHRRDHGPTAPGHADHPSVGGDRAGRPRPRAGRVLPRQRRPRHGQLRHPVRGAAPALAPPRRRHFPAAPVDLRKRHR